MKDHPAYEYFMQVKESKFSIDEEVGVVDRVSPSGKINFYGMGKVLKIDYAPPISTNNFYSKILSKYNSMLLVKLDNKESRLTTKEAYFLKKNDILHLLSLSGDIIMVPEHD